MRISRKTDYALRALVSLAEQEPGELVSIRQLAEDNDIPRRFLEQIMSDLRHCGWVRAVPGRTGGFELGMAAEDVFLGQVVRHFDGVLAPIGCVSVTQYESCSQQRTCRFRRVFRDVRDHTARLLDRLSLAGLLAVPPLSDKEVFSVFNDGGGI